MLLLTAENNISECVFTGKKFLCCQELTKPIRSHIPVKGFPARHTSQRGVITDPSRQFNISRPFVYDAISGLEAVLPIIF